MIGFLSGKVLESIEGRVLLGVGATAGMVGYTVNVPSSAEYFSLVESSDLTLYVHTNVREDALDLYGFQTREEKELFLTVTQVQGIGPKVGLGILSSVSPQSFVEAILTGDKALLTRIPGVGKKTAERMVLELAEPIKKKSEAGLLGKRKAAAPAGARASGARAGKVVDLREDAREALLGLGYREHQVTALLDDIFSESAPARVEDVVRAALRSLSGAQS